MLSTKEARRRRDSVDAKRNRRLLLEQLEQRTLLASFAGFNSLGNLFDALATCISGDGAVVAGRSSSGQPFRWTESDGMVALEHSSSHGPDVPEFISADGTVIVGFSMTDYDFQYGSAPRSLLWSNTGEVQDLGTLPGLPGLPGSNPRALTSDGSVVIGVATYQTNPFFGSIPAGPFLWTGGVMTRTTNQFLLENYCQSSTDGKALYGPSDGDVFRWTMDAGYQLWAAKPLGVGSKVTAISADGSSVAGLSSNHAALRWNVSGGLSTIASSDFTPQYMSSNGSVIVGQYRGEAGVWDLAHGTRFLKDVLSAAGVETTGWQLNPVTGISWDGEVIVGYGINPDGHSEGWRVDLRVDVSATSITYVEGPTVADDKLVLKYDITSVPAGQEPTLGLYWSTSDQYDDKRGLAYSVKAERDGETEIPVSALNARPNAPIVTTHLVLHVDDVPGNTDGEITTAEGDDDSNNYANLEITPEIDPTGSEWNYSQGGMDVTYDLKNRAFIDKPIIVKMDWKGAAGSVPGIRSAGSSFVVSKEKNEGESEWKHHIDWNKFATPMIGDVALELYFDPPVAGVPYGLTNEQNDDAENNTVREGVGQWQPQVIFTSSPFGLRKTPYDVAFTLKNVAPIDLDVELYWEEIVTSQVTENLPLNRGTKSAPVTIPYHFGESNSFILSLLDGKGKFIRSWDWIPSDFQLDDFFKDVEENVLQDATAKIAEVLEAEFVAESVKAAFGAKDVFEVWNLILKDPSPMVLEESIKYTVSATALVDQDGQQQFTNFTKTLLVPEARQTDLKLSKEAAATAKVLNNLAVAFFAETAGTSAALIISAGQEYQKAKVLYNKALDPPSPEFTQVFELNVNDGILDSLSAEPTTREFVRQRILLAALANAAAVTEDRVHGAREAGDAFWEARQLEALSAFQSRSAVEGVQQIGRSGLVQDWFAAELEKFGTVPVDPNFTLPDGLRALLIASGASEDELQFLETSAAETSLHSPWISQFLVLMDMEAALSNAVSAITSLEDAVTLRTNSLGEAIISISGTKVAEIVANEAEIEDRFSKGLPDASLRQQVETYLSDIRAQILATNNFDALREPLEFGYGALIKLQIDPPSVERLQRFIQQQDSLARIAPEVTGLLSASLDAAESRLKDGNFIEFSNTLENFNNIVDSYKGQGINPGTAESLNGFASYMQSFASDGLGNTNLPPELELIGDRSVGEGSLLTFTTAATDPNPGNVLTFTLDSGSPAGASINPTTGVFSWTPTDSVSTANVTVRVTDNGIPSLSATQTFAIEVNNVAPTAAIGGPDLGVRGQSRTFMFTATDPSPVDQATGFTYGIDWGDGTSQLVPTVSGNGAGFTLDHTYTSSGSFVIHSTATDKDGGKSAVVNRTIGITAVAIQPDPLDPIHNMLVVGGTSGNDNIEIERAGHGHMLAVEIRSVNDRSVLSVSDALSRIVVYGGDGDDHIQVGEKTAIPAWLFGGGGNDHLQAGGGPTLLMGGDGNDQLQSGKGPGVVVGGTGTDHLHGGKSDDILIAGTTDHDDNDTALWAILNEWKSQASYEDRVKHLQGTLAGGLNSSGPGGTTYLFNSATVHDDQAVDYLEGGDGLDWYFANLDGSANQRDKVSSLKKRELLTKI